MRDVYARYVSIVDVILIAEWVPKRLQLLFLSSDDESCYVK